MEASMRMRVARAPVAAAPVARHADHEAYKVG